MEVPSLSFPTTTVDGGLTFMDKLEPYCRNAVEQKKNLKAEPSPLSAWLGRHRP